ncbi:MAG TPA: hypothetical protein VF763_13700 [Candidatus Limnocylindrales bacterium]
MVLLLAGCGSGASATAQNSASAGTPSAARPSAAASDVPTSPVDGVVLHIDSTGLAAVQGFTLRTPDGHVYAFTLGQLDNGAQFPPGHLAEHQATGSPIRVSFRVEGGRLVVYRLEDAS